MWFFGLHLCSACRGGSPFVICRPVRAQKRGRSPDPAIVRPRLVPPDFGLRAGLRVPIPHGLVIPEQNRIGRRAGLPWIVKRNPRKSQLPQCVAPCFPPWIVDCKTFYTHTYARVYAHMRTCVRLLFSILLHNPQSKKKEKVKALCPNGFMPESGAIQSQSTQSNRGEL